MNAHFDHLTYNAAATPSVFHSLQEMHWDRTVARILLIFSVTNIALAAPAAVRPTHTGVAEAASEKRFSDDEATDGSASEPMPELVSDSDSSRYLSVSTDSGSNRYFSASESLDDSSPSGSLNDDLSPSGSSHDDWPPASPAASFREGPGVYQIFTFQGANWQYDSQSELDHDSAPESPDGSSHASHPDPARASPAVSLNQDSADSAPESPPSGLLHQDSVPGSPLHDAFFNDALKKKLMIYAGLGTIVVGVPVGLTIGVHKLIKDTHSHGVYVSPFFPPSSVTNVLTCDLPQ